MTVQGVAEDARDTMSTSGQKARLCALEGGRDRSYRESSALGYGG